MGKFWLAVVVCLTPVQAAEAPVRNRAPLAESAFYRLPLGAVKPKGWLLEQLRIQSTGITGHLDEFWQDVGPNSAWLGGTGEGWERGPYYLDGLLPLAYLLDDPKLIAKTKPWVEWTLTHQRADGGIGPEKNQDWWPIMIMLKVLTQYQEATGDPRVIPVMEKYFAYQARMLDGLPLKSWAIFRWQDELASILWLYNRDGDAKLLALAQRLKGQGFDWPGLFKDFPFTGRVTREQAKHDTHGVNNAMGLKTAALWYLISKDGVDRDGTQRMIGVLDKFEGLPNGMFSADEHFAGRNPSQGIELCAVVESMFSLELDLAVLGEAWIGDRLEKIAYNALPGTQTADLWSHQYDQQPNQVLVSLGKRDWTTNGAESNLFGLEPNYGCCTANLHQGWPKFTSALWMASSDGGLAVAAYAPSEVRTKVGGVDVTVTETTEYPFRNRVSLTVSPASPVRFPLHVRIPAWTSEAAIAVNGQRVDAAQAGSYRKIEREWRAGDRVEITLPMAVRVAQGFNGSVSVERGPLVYSLKIGEKWSKLKQTGPVTDWEVFPTSPWNYGLRLDGQNPAGSFEVQEAPVASQPFGSSPPVTLTAKARRLPQWVIVNDSAAAPPASPVTAGGRDEAVTLIPYGAARLRITSFPVLGPDLRKKGEWRLPATTATMNGTGNASDASGPMHFMKHLAPLALLFCANVWAQYPPDQQWRKIRTPHFDVIFPHGIEGDAQRAANALETMYKPLATSLGTESPPRTVVILANQGITRFGGGSVSLFPRMATFNMMPRQTFWGTNDWITTLTVTEARHLVQLAKMNHGYGKVASTFFGEAGLATTLGMALPSWWLQGDAAVAQTTMMRGGAAQYASSEMATRAMLLSGEHFSYMKAMHGSLKDGVPSQQELGSFLVSHVDRTSGADAWKEILKRTANTSFEPFAMSQAMKSVTGRSAATNYADTMSEIGELWKSNLVEADYSKPAIVNTAPRSAFTGYYQPAIEADGSVVAQKMGLDNFPVEVVRLRPDGREQKLFRFSPTVSGSNRTSVVKGMMVWDEYVPDVRWLRGYSEIMIRDLAAGHTRRLTHKTRFMNPVLSPDAARVAAVEFLADRSCSLVILDAATGAVLQRLPSPGNAMIYSPAWSADGRSIAMVTQASAGRALTMVELGSGKFTDLIPAVDEEIANPVFFGDYVLYKSSPNGAVDIYAVQISSGNRYRVTSSKFGADFPGISPDGTKLVYSDYSARGYNVAELPLDPATWTRIEAQRFTGIGYHGQVHDFSKEIPAATYPVGSYNPSLHLFDVHSWGFTGGPPNVGFGMQSNDKMRLMSFDASALYNTNEHKPGFATGVSYSRFFPVLYLGLSDEGRRLQYVDHRSDFTQRTGTAGFYVPLNFSRGSYQTGVSIGADVQDIRLQGGGLAPLGYSFGFTRQRQRSPRDLAPMWAQVLRLNYYQTPFAGQYTGNFLVADGRFALPGLMKHHALILEGGYERQHGSYTFASQIRFPRGYQAYTGTDLTKYSATYEMPLLYPDLSLLQAAYIKRISGNLFYDYGRTGNLLYRSMGVEAVFDTNFLHFPPPLRIGVRYAYRIDYGNRKIEPFIAFRW